MSQHRQESSWRVWQLLDSAFPVGALANSGGLEAAWQAGVVACVEDLQNFLKVAIEQAGSGSLPFVRAAHIDGPDVFTLDMDLDSFLTNHVANRASRLQGRALLRVATETFGVAELRELQAEISRRSGPGHLAVLFGIVTKCLGIEERTALCAYLFLVMRGVLSAAVRLGIVGPLEAQRLQAGLEGYVDQVVARHATSTVAEAYGGWPLTDVCQMGQDRLYSRLFQS